MTAKARRKSSKQLKQGKKMQPVKSLTLVCRKASGDQKLD